MRSIEVIIQAVWQLSIFLSMQPVLYLLGFTLFQDELRCERCGELVIADCLIWGICWPCRKKEIEQGES